jgi:predicted MPP superfamily phosphohydrolase
MSLFFLTVFLVYGGMHAYAYFRARNALGFQWGAGIALALFMLAMIVSPFLIRILEKNGYQLSARVLSHVAYIWMALIFLYFCASVALTGMNLVLRAAGFAAGNSPVFLLSPKPAFFAAAGLSLIICFYGFWSALDIKTERVRIETSRLPAGVDSVKIVQISDVHLGLIVRAGRLKRILALVKAENPDIFVSTGDLVDAQINEMTGLADLLREINPPYGKYAITGNHEYYAGLRQALAFTRNAGFTLLRDRAVTNGVINVAGVDDPAVVRNPGNRRSEEVLLSGLPKDRFTLLLKHRPTVDREASALFDLQLSGHTHKGQIYPFTYVSAMAYPMNAGRFDLPSGSVLRVSRGTGTWGPPVRFLSPPEVTVIELVRF